MLLCHGFPESWHSWRHQIAALATAGFHAVAPDMRGYGDTEQPEAIDQYTLLHLVGDMVGVLDALGVETAVIAGHDWGAPVAWWAALMRPDRFRGVIGLSVPYMPRGAVRPTTVMPQTEHAVFYQLYFQEPGVAEADLERDPRFFLRGVLYTNSGDGPFDPARDGKPGQVGMVPRDSGMLARMKTHMVQPAVLPRWITEGDVDFLTATFLRTGFRGGLNYYRNIDRNWELLGVFAGAKVTVPSLFIAGDRDLVMSFEGMSALTSRLSAYAPGLRQAIVLPGCGHWTQQERPAAVTEAMLGFLRSV